MVGASPRPCSGLPGGPPPARDRLLDATDRSPAAAADCRPPVALDHARGARSERVERDGPSRRCRRTRCGLARSGWDSDRPPVGHRREPARADTLSVASGHGRTGRLRRVHPVLEAAAQRDHRSARQRRRQGLRSVASFDEDTTSLGVEAGATPWRWRPRATAERGRLRHHGAGVPRQDQRHRHPRRARPRPQRRRRSTPSARCAAASARAWWPQRGRRPRRAVSDIRTGLPGGADESNGGDAAVVLCFGDGRRRSPRSIGGASVTAEFVDRWREPGAASSKQWEERFGEHAYVPARRGGHRRRAEGRRAGHRRPRPGDHHRPAQPGRRRRAQGRRRHAAAARRRPHRRDRQHRHRPLGAAAGRRARQRRARPEDPRGQPGRRLRRRHPADHRGARRRAPAGAQHRAQQIDGDAHRPRPTPVPHVARLPAPRAAAPARARPPGRPAVAAHHRVEVRLRRQPRRGRLRPPARRRGSAWAAARSTTWKRCAWPTCRAPSPRSPSTAWPTA